MPNSPRRRTHRLIWWLVTASLVVHLTVLVAVRPWARTTMSFDREQMAARAERVAEREAARQAREESRRRNQPIPERYRDPLKREAERMHQDRLREKVRRMLEDRDLAERQREKAFERLRRRDKAEQARRSVVTRLAAAIEDTQEKVDVFKSGKPNAKKTDDDRQRDQMAQEAADRLEAVLGEMADAPGKAGELLDEARALAEQLDRAARGAPGRDEHGGKAVHETISEAYEIKAAVRDAKAAMAEIEKLHDTSDAAHVDDAPPAAKKVAGTQKPGGEQPDAADLYDAARRLEQQIEAFVDDTRAAEIAERTQTSFGTAKKKLTTHSPLRPDLAERLRHNPAGTVGELKAHRETLRRAGSEVSHMAARTATMTRGVQSVQDRRAALGADASAYADAARRPGYADMTEAGLGVAGGSIGNSGGMRMGTEPWAGVDGDTGRQEADLQLPKQMVTANALPGRMLTDASARQGWLYLDTWYVIGPWPVDYKDKFGTPYPPEVQIDFDAVYTNGKFKDRPEHPYHKMRWRFVQSDEIKLQPPEVFGGETWYAYTEVYSDKTRDMLLAAASDDFAKVWLNDQVVWDDPQQSAWSMGEALRKVTFRKGYNTILLRIGNGPGPLVWSVLVSPPEVLNYLEPAAGTR